ncbi:hypothetical protein [Bremerella sp.]|uniref:hypothetical protein n=1 Tax=Bremerella sp. TaxID=2795602 RepID=UPI00391DD166
MQHKAFLFDSSTFELELKLLLVQSLVMRDCASLISFIVSNLDVLSDPYEGEPLDETWQNLLETRDAHQLGDFALTKYYDPADDLGLGDGWDNAQQFAYPLAKALGYSPILGTTIGTTEEEFDPGKMGSYIQSVPQVEASLRALIDAVEDHWKEALEEVISMIQLLEAAAKLGKGLYITF